MMKHHPHKRLEDEQLFGEEVDDHADNARS